MLIMKSQRTKKKKKYEEGERKRLKKVKLMWGYTKVPKIIVEATTEGRYHSAPLGEGEKGREAYLSCWKHSGAEGT